MLVLLGHYCSLKIYFPGDPVWIVFVEYRILPIWISVSKNCLWSTVCRNTLLWQQLQSVPRSYLRYSALWVWVAVIFLLPRSLVVTGACRKIMVITCPPSADLWQVIVSFFCVVELWDSLVSFSMHPAASKCFLKTAGCGTLLSANKAD